MLLGKLAGHRAVGQLPTAGNGTHPYPVFFAGLQVFKHKAAAAAGCTVPYSSVHRFGLGNFVQVAQGCLYVFYRTNKLAAGNAIGKGYITWVGYISRFRLFGKAILIKQPDTKRSIKHNTFYTDVIHLHLLSHL